MRAHPDIDWAAAVGDQETDVTSDPVLKGCEVQFFLTHTSRLMVVSPIGSDHILVIHKGWSGGQVVVQTGCFQGGLTDFEQRLEQMYSRKTAWGERIIKGAQYRAALRLWDEAMAKEPVMPEAYC